MSTTAAESCPSAVDHRGRPISRFTTTGGWRSAFFVIGVEIAERFAYYGIASNLITYMTGPLGKPTAAAAANVNAWSGAASMLPLLGGFVADSFLGRYATILVASALYLLGLGMLTLSAMLPTHLHASCDNISPCGGPSTLQIAFFFLAIYTVALAQGFHKPCAQAFAADQFDEGDPEESKSKSSFFNWWYCAMCIGTTAALLVVNYVQDNIGWALGFGIPFAAMVVAVVLFLLGTRTYRYYRARRKKSPFGAVAIEASAVGASEQSANAPDGCPSMTDHGQHEDENIRLPSLLKDLTRLFPIWATCLIYAVIFSQTTTLFTKQGATMNGRISRKLKVPPAALQTFISFTIVICIPVYDRVFVPAARKATKIQSGITPLQRIGTGQFLSVVTMVTAAVVEAKRLRTAKDFGLLDSPKAVVPMSLWWLVPQYMVFGIADVFTIIGMQEFFYDQAPSRLRSFGLALYLSILGIGSFISSIMIIVIDKATGKDGSSWFSSNLNRAHIDYFYWLLALLSGLELVLFIYFSRAYIYKL